MAFALKFRKIQVFLKNWIFRKSQNCAIIPFAVKTRERAMSLLSQKMKNQLFGKPLNLNTKYLYKDIKLSGKNLEVFFYLMVVKPFL